MVFVDRVSAYPNRYTLTTEDGNKYYVTLERADNPITEGTPLNAETLNDMVYELNRTIDNCEDRLMSEVDNCEDRLMSEVGQIRTWMGVKDALYIQSTYFPGCYYRMVDDEQEWINPPMQVDVEYRTTERVGNAPVYTKQFVLTEIPSDGQTQSFSIGSESRYYNLKIDAHIQMMVGGEVRFFPITNGVYTDAWLEVKAGNSIVIRTRTGTDFSGYTAFITLKYTK